MSIEISKVYRGTPSVCYIKKGGNLGYFIYDE